MDAESLANSVIRDLVRLGGRMRREDLKVRGNDCGVSVDVDPWQPGKMSKSAGNGRLVTGLLDHRSNRLVSARALAAAKIDDAILGIDAARKIIGAAVSARWVARDQIEDFEPILNGTDATPEVGASVVEAQKLSDG